MPRIATRAERSRGSTSPAWAAITSIFRRTKRPRIPTDSSTGRSVGRRPGGRRICPAGICWTSATRCVDSISGTFRRIIRTNSTFSWPIPGRGSRASPPILVEQSTEPSDAPLGYRKRAQPSLQFFLRLEWFNFFNEFFWQMRRQQLYEIVHVNTQHRPSSKTDPRRVTFEQMGGVERDQVSIGRRIEGNARKNSDPETNSDVSLD